MDIKLTLSLDTTILNCTFKFLYMHSHLCMQSLILITSETTRRRTRHVTRFYIVICEDLVFHILTDYFVICEIERMVVGFHSLDGGMQQSCNRKKTAFSKASVLCIVVVLDDDGGLVVER